MTLSVISNAKHHLIVDSHCADQLQLKPEVSWFNADFWRDKQAIVGTASGRGTTYFVKHDNHVMVLRRYRRGGLIRHLSDDKFVFNGLKRTRAWAELQLLATMNHQNLPVPVGIAGLVTRNGFSYHADILTLCINKSQDVHGLLCQRALHQSHWHTIGKTIRELHDAQVYHHDLNIHNILQDNSGKIWIIDFDKCFQRAGDKWKLLNLHRLKRSLEKEMSQETRYYFTEQNWQALLEGYGTTTVY